MTRSMRPPSRPAASLLGGLLILLAAYVPRVAAQENTDGAPADDPAGEAAGPANEIPDYFFYQPETPYGSAAQFSPLNVLATRGFSTLMWSDSERHPLRIDWGNGIANLWDAIASPHAAIERSGGFRAWLHDEFLPEGWNVWSWAFAPNYAGHVIAGGITARGLGEWFDAHGAPAPRVLGGVAAMATILVNEAIESRNGTAGYSSTTADVYVFEPLGIALFSVDGVARWFSTRLHAADWSPQASLTLPHLQLLNNSQLMSYHAGLPFSDRLDWLFVTGQGSQVGVLYDLGPEYRVAVAGGFTASSQLIDDRSNESLVAKAGAGAYLVRNNSLLANVNVFRGGETRVVVNVYPGTFRGPFRELGSWAMVNRGGDFSLGMSYRRMLGLGIGYDFWRTP